MTDPEGTEFCILGRRIRDAQLRRRPSFEFTKANVPPRSPSIRYSAEDTADFSGGLGLTQLPSRVGLISRMPANSRGGPSVAPAAAPLLRRQRAFVATSRRHPTWLSPAVRSTRSQGARRMGQPFEGIGYSTRMEAHSVPGVDA